MALPGLATRWDLAQLVFLMLRIGQNEYELVFVNSGFTVYVYPPNEAVLKREQLWILELHYVPSATHYTPREDGEIEYLNVQFRAEEYAVKDWRQLSGLGLDTEEDSWFGFASAENLVIGDYREESWKVLPGWLEVEHTHDYLFHCKFDGSLVRTDGTEVDMEFEDDVPFREAIVYVPLNAANPVNTARAMVARNFKLTESAGSQVHPYDPTKPAHPSIHINSHHTVHLTTPWRQQLA